MKAFYFPSAPQTNWLNMALPGMNHAELPVAGRLFIDYALEAAGRFGVESAVMVDKTVDEKLERKFAVDRDGLCSVSTLRLATGLPRNLAELQAASFFHGAAASPEPVIVMWGHALPFYHPGETAYEPVPEDALRVTPNGIYHISGGRWFRPAVGNAAIRNPISWLDVSIRILGGEGGYTLPGYSAENGVHICRNVVMERGTEAKPPVLLCDDSWCARGVRLDGLCVVGRGSFVGARTKLVRTMVCDDTFVGSDMELEDKIVIGHRVFDGKTGAWTDVGERGVVGALRGVRLQVPRPVSWIVSFLRGRSFGRRRK